MAEQRYQAVLAVISDGLSISQVASKVGVSRQTLHSWLARYEAEGLEGLVDRSHRPVSCPHQMPAEVEAALVELRRSRPYWGPRRLVFELTKRQVSPVPSESAAGIDDHSRMCVSARLMARERTRAVCDGLQVALATYGAPEQILTDNGKVFTGRFNHPPVEVRFDAICRTHGIEHLLTQPRSPTTTGKIERFHRSLRAEFLAGAAPFTNLKTAQQALDEWVVNYNTTRPHQALKMATPADRFHAGAPTSPPSNSVAGRDDRGGQDWVSRRVCANGVVCVSWQQVCIGRHYAGARCDVHVDGELLRFWVGDDLVKTAARNSSGEVRNKRALRSSTGH